MALLVVGVLTPTVDQLVHCLIDEAEALVLISIDTGFVFIQSGFILFVQVNSDILFLVVKLTLMLCFSVQYDVFPSVIVHFYCCSPFSGSYILS